MPLTDEELRAVVTSNLTSEERDRGVAYVAPEPVPAGAVLEFPSLTLPVPWEAVLAFVDREPLANWSHSCRYFLARRDGDEVMSVDARFPPFRSLVPLNWRVIHQAPGVPDSALGVAKT
jgi:hypothetical protein